MMQAHEVMRLVAIFLDRQGGEAFIHDSDLAAIRHGDRVHVIHDPAAKGIILRLERENEIDIGEAKIVKPRAISGPPA